MVNRFGIDYFTQILREDDEGLLYRSLEAANLYAVAEQMQRDQSVVTPEQAGLLIPLKDAVSGKKHGR